MYAPYRVVWQAYSGAKSCVAKNSAALMSNRDTTAESERGAPVNNVLCYKEHTVCTLQRSSLLALQKYVPGAAGSPL